ncbi:Up-regulated during septation domain-containing protein [Trichoderma sp. SZMC 28012]
MDHIVGCMNGAGHSTMSRAFSPALQMLSSTPLAALSDSEKPTSRKMQQEGQGKYQLFPKGRQSPSFNNSASVDPETAFAMAMNGEWNEKPGATQALKIKVNQQTIGRRRKVTIPELGPMTTVQEITMDSPTIPGRPPLRERSSSAPQDGAAQDTVPPLILGRAIYAPPKQIEIKRGVIDAQPPRLPSPKRLAPLVIPEPEQLFMQYTQKPSPPTHLETDTPLLSTGINQYLTPISSSTSDSSGPLSSSSTEATSAHTLPTPVSASIMEKSSAVKQWEPRMPLSANRAEDSSYSHRRFASESQGDRGRPRKRKDQHKKSNSHPGNGEKKRSKSAEQRAFEELPSGYKPEKAVSQMSANDLGILRQQALGQAERFEVLRVEDVESLSKELRRLDERAEYLRRTYNSLRNGRRNFHSRICQYLRSPMRGSRLTAESMLRQEEALAELDASIDGWVIKLERTENRRTRVRQKLLEHIAAAAILSVRKESPPPQQRRPSSPVQQPSPVQIRVVQDIATPPRSPTQTTFNNRPESASPPPLRVVAQVPSMILELPAEEVVPENKVDLSRKSTMKSSDGESIRIYAGDELFALLTDVEDEIIRMNNAIPEPSPIPESATPEPNPTPAPVPEPEAKSEFLQIGHEVPRSSNFRLSAQPDSPTLAPSPMLPKSFFFKPPTATKAIHSPVPPSPPAPVPPLKDIPKEPEIFLTSAVFKPK